MENWTSPQFEEIKMDAEIGSYQEDREPFRDEIPVATRLDARQVCALAQEAAE